ncbi:Hypothetical protein Lpp22_2488 [Lacticaseibacillus paracasei subsp. paracasei Lpp22]|uniref:Uncharacterized protein n=1 Tax=Lacticaseibacillus paracasei subsp. paracasei Lpp22 TaxID=1256221 RepID=A0A8E0M4I8_LACPA|nr:Hypothetical protein Lpp22_2488 [Lacticaseibacillus paracasei subsp. paracasei Lpp22]
MQPCLFSIFRDEQQNANSRSFSDLMPEDKRLFLLISIIKNVFKDNRFVSKHCVNQWKTAFIKVL